jgi:hypothetical protein
MSKAKKPTAGSPGTPSVVLRAFAPETNYTLTLDGYILLEALGCGLMKGTGATMRDMILAILVMTDEEAVMAARKSGRIEALISKFTEGKRPGEIRHLIEKANQAFEEATAPSDTGGAASEKKSSAESDGG